MRRKCSDAGKTVLESREAFSKTTQLYLAGKTVLQIAKSENIQKNTVYNRLRRCGTKIRPHPGSYQERHFQNRCRDKHGRNIIFMGYYAPYDFLVDGKWRIEFKYGFPQNPKGNLLHWRFNIHRHGKLKEECDFYVFRLLDVPYSKAAINLLVRSPIGRKTFSISFRQLLSEGSEYVKDFKSLMRGELSNRK